MDLEIRQEPRRRIAYLEHRGAYQEIGSTFERLANAMRKGGLLTGDFQNGIGIYFDDPSTVPVEQLRSWAGLVVREDVSLPSDVWEGTVEGGRYAVLAHMGSYENMMESWEKAFGQMHAAGLTQRPLPPFELYVNDIETTPIDQVRTDICIPIE